MTVDQRIAQEWTKLVKQAHEMGYGNEDPRLLMERIIELLEDETDEGPEFRSKEPEAVNYIQGMADGYDITLTTFMDAVRLPDGWERP